MSNTKEKAQKYMGGEQDLSQNMIERKWKDVEHHGFQVGDFVELQEDKTVTLKMLHWNILAAKLCDAFDLIDDDAPMLRWRNRLRLMEQHFKAVDADIVGLAEVDAINGNYPDAAVSLNQMM